MVMKLKEKSFRELSKQYIYLVKNAQGIMCLALV